MSKKLRGALIGCGFFSANHLAAWRDIESAEIVAVCDRDGGKARSAAERFSIATAYSEAEAMFAAHPRLDFVDIAASAPAHRVLVETAAPHARLIICQKPMANSMADAEAMVAAADGAGTHLLIHENFRWQKPMQAIADVLRDGRLGRLHFAHITFRHGYDNYVNQPYLKDLERFTIMDVGLHLFDLVRVFMGEAETLACRTQRLHPEVHGEDAFTCLIGHESGATSVVDCSFRSTIKPEPFPQTLVTIEGDRGTLQLGADYRLSVHDAGGVETVDVEPAVPHWGDRPWHAIQQSVVSLQAHALEVLAGRVECSPSGRDNLSTLRMALAAYDADASQSIITLRDWVERRS